MLDDYLPLDGIERLTPTACRDILTLMSQEEFVWFMRRTLPPEELERLTDRHLHVLHAELCKALQAKASRTIDEVLNKSEFVRRWLAAVDQLTPQESSDILLQASADKFVGVMRALLPEEESRALTDQQLRQLHAVMCERLDAKAGRSLEVSEPAGQA